MKRFIALLLVTGTILVSGIHPSSADVTWSAPYLGCSEFSITFTSTTPYVTLAAGNPSAFSSTIDLPMAGGLTSKPTVQNFAVTPNVPTRLVLKFPTQPAGTLFLYNAFSTNSSSPFDNTNDNMFAETVPCNDNFPGRPLPDGFVLKTIVCDTPIYDSPKGNIVADTRITAGQTWYVGPTTIDGFTEIYASGEIDGFVPSRCVQ